MINITYLIYLKYVACYFDLSNVYCYFVVFKFNSLINGTGVTEACDGFRSLSLQKLFTVTDQYASATVLVCSVCLCSTVKTYN